MSQVEKDLLVSAIFPLILLLIGVILAWFVFGPQTIVWLKALLSVKMVFFLVLFAVVGLIFTQPALKAVSMLSFSDQTSIEFKNRRGLFGGMIALIVIVLFTSFLTAFPDWSRESLAETALYLIIFGLGLSVMSGTIFTCASIIRFRSQRGS